MKKSMKLGSSYRAELCQWYQGVMSSIPQSLWRGPRGDSCLALGAGHGARSCSSNGCRELLEDVILAVPYDGPLVGFFQ